MQRALLADNKENPKLNEKQIVSKIGRSIFEQKEKKCKVERFYWVERGRCQEWGGKWLTYSNFEIGFNKMESQNIVIHVFLNDL